MRSDTRYHTIALLPVCGVQIMALSRNLKSISVGKPTNFISAEGTVLLQCETFGINWTAYHFSLEPMAWKILQGRVQSSTYFPLGVIVPKHFLEDLALTGKSDYGTIGFAGMVPLRVKQIFCVLELLCLLSKSERPLALPAYHRVPVHCITKICWKEKMPSEGNRGMTISLFFFCSIRRVLNSAPAADKAKRKSNQRNQIKNTLHPMWPCLLPIPSASTVETRYSDINFSVFFQRYTEVSLNQRSHAHIIDKRSYLAPVTSGRS